jgi:hypothetical protein
VGVDEGVSDIEEDSVDRHPIRPNPRYRCFWEVA